MSEFAFFRFMTYNLLTLEEQQHKDEIVSLTEQVLDARGIECDSKISKISEEQLKAILEEVRKLRKKKKNEQDNDKDAQDQLDLASTVVDKLGNSSRSSPPIWLLIYGIGIIIFSIFLFSLRAWNKDISYFYGNRSSPDNALALSLFKK